MITEQGTVVDITPTELVVEVLKSSACQSCQAKQGCGQAVLSEWGDQDRQQAKNHFRIPYNGSAAIGSQVELGMDADIVSKVAIVVYVAPLLIGFAGLFAASQLGLAEWLQLISLAVPMAAAFSLIPRLIIPKHQQLTPRIIRLYPPGKETDIIASTLSTSV